MIVIEYKFNNTFEINKITNRQHFNGLVVKKFKW